MYSYEDRIKAVELYIKYGLCAADTIREFGYPDYSTLVQWYKEYQITGELHEGYIKQPRYTLEHMQVAVNYYLNHGRSISRTIRSVGYPSKHILKDWIDELATGERKIHMSGGVMVQYSQEQKKDAVIELFSREGPAATVVDRFGASRYSLYKWKKELLGKEDAKTMEGSGKPPLPNDRDVLLSEVKSLKKKIYQKQMELDILNKAAEIIKKDLGINPWKLANREKVSLIDALRTEYPLSDLLMMTGMPKSSYFYQKEAHKRLDKHYRLRAEVKAIFADNQRCYGQAGSCHNQGQGDYCFRKGCSENHGKGTACRPI